MKLSRDNSHLRYRNYEDILQFGTKWRTMLYTYVPISFCQGLENTSFLQVVKSE